MSNEFAISVSISQGRVLVMFGGQRLETFIVLIQITVQLNSLLQMNPRYVCCR